MKKKLLFILGVLIFTMIIVVVWVSGTQEKTAPLAANPLKGLRPPPGKPGVPAEAAAKPVLPPGFVAIPGAHPMLAAPVAAVPGVKPPAAAAPVTTATA